MMKTINKLTAVLFLSSCFSMTYADTFDIQYNVYRAYVSGACEAVASIIDSKAPLVLTYEKNSNQGVTLVNAKTPKVSISQALALNKEENDNGKTDYISDTATQLKTEQAELTLKQVWIESSTEQGPWESAFYLGDYCLVMTSSSAEPNNLSQPRW